MSTEDLSLDFQEQLQTCDPKSHLRLRQNFLLSLINRDYLDASIITKQADLLVNKALQSEDKVEALIHGLSGVNKWAVRQECMTGIN